jgi:hypothetical protein
MVTGEYGGQIFPPLIAELQQRVQGLQVDLLVVKNDFLGDLVRCAGLLSGRDVLAALQQQHLTPNSRVLMPGVALKDAAVIGEGARGMLLDDISLQNLADRFLVPFVNAGSTCEDWLTALFGQADEVYWPHPENPSELVIHQYPEHQKAS